MNVIQELILKSNNRPRALRALGASDSGFLLPIDIALRSSTARHTSSLAVHRSGCACAKAAMPTASLPLAPALAQAPPVAAPASRDESDRVFLAERRSGAAPRLCGLRHRVSYAAPALRKLRALGLRAVSVPAVARLLRTGSLLICYSYRL